MYGNNSSYTKMILDAGFDGAYLDIIDGYEYFEDWNTAHSSIFQYALKKATLDDPKAQATTLGYS